MADPGRAEVLAWMARTGQGAAAAVDHFFPTCGDEDRARHAGRFRLWAHREGRGMAARPGRQDGGNRDDPPVEGPARPDPDYATTDLDKVAFLRWQLAEDLADLAWARAAGLIGRVSQLDARVSEVRLQLDQARAAAGTTVELDATPEQIAAEVDKRQRRINELLAARARRDRDL